MNSPQVVEIMNRIINQNQQLIDIIRQSVQSSVIVEPERQDTITIPPEPLEEPPVIIEAEPEPPVIIEAESIITNDLGDIDTDTDNENDYLQFRKNRSPEEIRIYISIRKKPDFRNLICTDFHCTRDSKTYKLWERRIYYHQYPEKKRIAYENTSSYNERAREIARESRTFVQAVNTIDNR